MLQECLLRAPEERNCLRMRASVLVGLDRLDQARTIVARLSKLDPTFSYLQNGRRRGLASCP